MKRFLFFTFYAYNYHTSVQFLSTSATKCLPLFASVMPTSLALLNKSRNRLKKLLKTQTLSAVSNLSKRRTTLLARSSMCSSYISTTLTPPYSTCSAASNTTRFARSPTALDSTASPAKPSRPTGKSPPTSPSRKTTSSRASCPSTKLKSPVSSRPSPSHK